METALEILRSKPHGKKWRIIKLEKPTCVARDAEEFSSMLKTAFKPLFKTVIKVDEDDGALWAQIEILGIGAHKTKQSTYLVHYPHARFVFVSLLQSLGVHEAINTAVSISFGCMSVSVINCSGSDLNVLADIALYPLSQGHFGCYRLYTALLDSDPLGREYEDREIETKRRRVRVQDRTETRAENLMELGGDYLNPFHETNNGVISNLLPTSNLQANSGSGALTRVQRAEQPKGTQSLNRLEMTIGAPLQWRGESIPFSCAIVVTGTSVMQGLDRLSKRGLVADNNSNVSGALGDASNVIRNAFNTKLKLTRRGRPSRKQPLPYEEEVQGPGGLSVKAVKLVAV